MVLYHDSNGARYVQFEPEKSKPEPKSHWKRIQDRLLRWGTKPLTPFEFMATSLVIPSLTTLVMIQTGVIEYLKEQQPPTVIVVPYDPDPDPSAAPVLPPAAVISSPHPSSLPPDLEDKLQTILKAREDIKIASLSDFTYFMSSAVGDISLGEGERRTENVLAFQNIAHYKFGFNLPLDGVAGEQSYAAATRIRNNSEFWNGYRTAAQQYHVIEHRVEVNGQRYTIDIPQVALDSFPHNHREEYTHLIIPNDPLIQQLVQEIIAGVQSKEEKARRLVRFVQDGQVVHYQYDIGQFGKYALETLADGTGDCEDSSILAATLLRAAGIDARLAQVTNSQEHYGHLMILVEGNFNEENINQWTTTVNGKRFYVTETTGTWGIGQIPPLFLDPANKTKLQVGVEFKVL